MGNRLRGQNICSSQNVAEKSPSTEKLENSINEVSEKSEVKESKLEQQEVSSISLSTPLETGSNELITENIVKKPVIITTGNDIPF